MLFASTLEGIIRELNIFLASKKGGLLERGWGLIREGGLIEKLRYYIYYVMLCYAMLCYVVFCSVMLCFVMLCYVMFCSILFCYVMLCYAMVCYVNISWSVILLVYQNAGIETSRKELFLLSVVLQMGKQRIPALAGDPNCHCL